MEDLLSGFKPIPGYNGYWINEENVILDYENLCCEVPVRYNDDYVWVYLHDIKKAVQLHQLKAAAFCEKPEGCNIVNHMDGDKQNNASSNLEWTTYSGNLIHAYKNGLREDNTPMQVIDSKTDQYYEFYSLQDCARFFNVNGEQIYRYMNSARSSLFMKRYVLMYLTENIDEVKEKIVSEHMNGCSKFVQGECVETGAITVYSSVGCAARVIGVKAATLGATITRSINKVMKGFRWSYADSDEVTDVISDWVKPKPPKRLPLKINVFDNDTQTSKIWESVNMFADWLGVGRSGVKKAIYKNGGWRNYKIEYIK